MVYAVQTVLPSYPLTHSEPLLEKVAKSSQYMQCLVTNPLWVGDSSLTVLNVFRSRLHLVSCLSHSSLAVEFGRLILTDLLL